MKNGVTRSRLFKSIAYLKAKGFKLPKKVQDAAKSINLDVSSVEEQHPQPNKRSETRAKGYAIDTIKMLGVPVSQVFGKDDAVAKPKGTQADG